MKIVIVSGGTGGHIYPGIAIAEEIKMRDTNASILFLGSEKGLEKELVAGKGYAIKLIKSRKTISSLFISLIGFFQALVILRGFSPKALIATGGYASLPAVLAAKVLRIPIVLHEQNVLPGTVNRLGQRLAEKVFLSFAESLKYIPGEVVGNPVRREILEAQKENARGKLNLPLDKKVILVMGGSQGSKKINETVISSLANLPADKHILHIVGARDFGWVNSYLKDRKINNYQAFPYVHEMGNILAAADIVISRAGATAIAEFLVRGLPMVLIPFPYAADNHQLLNAKAVADAGGAIIVDDRDFTPARFIELINDAALNYDKMSQAVKKLARPQAAKRIVSYIYA